MHIKKHFYNNFDLYLYKIDINMLLMPEKEVGI